jgi:hypothetical protein
MEVRKQVFHELNLKLRFLASLLKRVHSEVLVRDIFSFLSFSDVRVYSTGSIMGSRLTIESTVRYGNNQ